MADPNSFAHVAPSTAAYGLKSAALEEGDPAATGDNEYRDTVTLRVEQLLKHQTWKLGLFFFESPADRDYLFQPQTSYKLSDEFSATLGANIFGGQSEATFLGQFDRNDNIHVSLRFDF